MSKMCILFVSPAILVAGDLESHSLALIVADSFASLDDGASFLTVPFSVADRVIGHGIPFVALELVAYLLPVLAQLLGANEWSLV